MLLPLLRTYFFSMLNYLFAVTIATHFINIEMIVLLGCINLNHKRIIKNVVLH